MKTRITILLVWLAIMGSNLFFNTGHAQVSLCAGEEVCLTTSARGTIQWQQSVDAITFTNVSNGQGDTVCLTPSMSWYFRAVVWEGTCDSVVSDTQLVTVFPAVVADAGGDHDLCLGDTVALGGSPTGSGGTAPYTYSWLPAIGLDLPTGSNPLAFPGFTTSYIVTVTDTHGCTAMDTAMIILHGLPVADAGPDVSTSCITAVQIGGSPTGSGGTGPLAYSWNPTNGLNLPTAANPMALPAANTTYTVTVTDSLGCSAEDDVLVTLTGAVTGADTFSFSGMAEMWIVPGCIDTLQINVWGAQGGFDGTIPGGLGGFAEGQLVVSPGDTLWFYVGGQGASGPGSGQNCNLLGGWNGGGTTGDTCCSNAGGGAGAGGGGSDVRVGGQGLGNRVIVGAGGGGAGSNAQGAAGGGLVGSNGGAYSGVTAIGGTQSAGGAPGGHFTAHTCSWGTAGTFGQGGKGDGNDGGGGGGGWYGGGGGPNNGGGAGGSSYFGGVLNGSTTGGLRTGNGLIMVSW